MNKETKTLFITLGGALLLIWLLRPKNSKSTKGLLDVKYAEPKQVSDTETKLKEKNHCSTNNHKENSNEETK